MEERYGSMGGHTYCSIYTFGSHGLLFVIAKIHSVLSRQPSSVPLQFGVQADPTNKLIVLGSKR